MAFIGTWDLESSEKWDDYLKELGVGFVSRKAAASVKPTVIFSTSGNKWTIKVQSSLKTTEFLFEDGVPFEEKTMDGRDCISTIKLESPTKMVQEQRDVKTKAVTSTITREIINNKFVQTLTAGSVVCKRIYTKTA